MQIVVRWDKYKTGLLFKKLLTHVRRGEIKISVNVEKGSIRAEILIIIIEEAIRTGFTILPLEYLKNRQQEEKKKGNILDEPEEFVDREGRNLYDGYIG
ncbi:MAG: hypothetical protein ACOCRX_08485 [Candidatus Woesearchaeota archaeon]